MTTQTGEVVFENNFSREELNTGWAKWLREQSDKNEKLASRVESGKFDSVTEACARGILSAIADHQDVIDEEMERDEEGRNYTVLKAAEENRDLLLSTLEGKVIDTEKIAEFEENQRTLEAFGFRFAENPGPLIIRIQAALQEFSKKPWIEELEINGQKVEVIQANKGIGNTPTNEKIKSTDRSLVLGEEPITAGESLLDEDTAREELEKRQKLYQLFQQMFETTVAYEKSGGSPKDRATLLHEVDPRQQYAPKTEAFITSVPHNILQQYVRKNFSQGQKKEEADGLYRPNITPIVSVDDLKVLLDEDSGQLEDSQLGALEIQFVYSRQEAQKIAKFAQEHKLVVLDIYKPSSEEWKPYDVGIGDLNGMKDITVTAHTAGSIKKGGEELRNIPVQMLTGPAMLVGNIKGNLETHFGTPSGPQKELLLQLLADPQMISLLNNVSGDYEKASKQGKLAMVAKAILNNDKELLEKVAIEAEEKFRQLYYQDSEKGDLLEAGEIVSLPGAGRFALRSLAQYFHQQKNEEGSEEAKDVRYLTFKPAWPYAKVLGLDVANIDHIEATENYLPDPEELDRRLQKAKDSDDEEVFDVVILNYPNNPSGVVPDKDRLKDVYKVCIKHGVRVINDNSYMNVVSARDVLANSALSSFELMDELIREAEVQGDPNIGQFKKWRDNQLYEANALTKTVNQPSARVGFVGTKDRQAQEHLRRFMKENLDGEHNHMALAFFNNFADDSKAVQEKHDPLVRKTIKERINITTRVIEEEDGVECVVPEGAFYVNVDFRKYIDYDGNQGDLLNSTWFSGDRIGLLLSEYFGVTEFPNETMKGKNGILRFGLGGPMEDPEEFARTTKVAIRRIKAYIDIARVKVAKLQKGTNISHWDDEAIEMVKKYFSEDAIENDEYVVKWHKDI